MSRRYAFSFMGSAGSAEYRDGAWQVELESRTASHRLLRVALARVIGASPTLVAGLANKILSESHADRHGDVRSSSSDELS